MKILKKIVEQYNQKDALLIISTYPKQGEIYSKDVDAVAPYAKNTILGIKKNRASQKIIVLAPCIRKNDKYSYYVENNVLVIRCFKRNSLLSLTGLLKYVKIFTNVFSILVEFEFSSYGDTKSTISLPFVLVILVLLGKRITLVLHQVVYDLAELSGHLDITKDGYMTKIMNWFLRKYYKLVTAPVHSVIVLEDAIKNRLANLINPEKIHVVYHGVDSMTKQKNISKENAREKLEIKRNEFVILYFGYITWYKGADFLVEALRNKKNIGKKNIKVILAGGKSSTQNHKLHYQRFYKRVESVANKTKHITLTGFVEEQKLSIYFSACDLVIFPYRTFMSSSGALATVFAFEKPFIVSSELREYFESEDMAELLRTLRIHFKDISFKLNEKSLWLGIQKAIQENIYTKLTTLSKRIKKQRNFANLTKKYIEITAIEKNLAGSTERRFTFPFLRLPPVYENK